uniref:Uncharacterized protein n=1 Tax=Acrobeloides nanus TaxID=290746 RepID=A0A914E1D4_9BILA
MSSAKPLVDAQCGQANPLVQLSQNFSQNNAKLASGVERQLHAVMPSVATGDAMAQEYLARVARQTPAPASFNMQSLIRQLPQSSSASNLSQQWGKEFLKSRPKAPIENFSAQWTQQYISNSPSMNAAWAQAQTSGSSSMMELESAWNSATGQISGTSQGLASVLYDFEEEFFYALTYKNRMKLAKEMYIS